MHDALTLRTQYWDDPAARSAFKAFMIEIFGLDFAAWEAAGYWDPAYTPFSLFAGEKIVASACIYLLDFVIDGRPTRLAQVSGVGTLPEWRRRGLSREVTDVGLAWAEGKHEGVFLFADRDAVPFYARCGFSPLDEYVACAELAPVTRRAGAVRLDPTNPGDRDRIFTLASRRAAVSRRFGILSPRLFMFHALYMLSDCIWDVPDLQCLVMFRRTAGLLAIYDIVGERIPPFDELYPCLADASDRVVEFHFETDRLGLEGIRTRKLEGNYPFVRSEFPVRRPVFPFTCRA